MLAVLLAQAPDPPEGAGDAAISISLTTVGTILGIVVMGTTLGGLTLRALDKRIKRQLGGLERQTATQNGRTLGQVVEHTAGTVDAVDRRLQAVEQTARNNQETAVAALALARQSHDRLDSHLTGHHKEE